MKNLLENLLEKIVYSDAFILVTGDVTLNVGNHTHVAFRNCAPYSTWKTEINDIFIDETNHIYVPTPLYYFTEHSDDYSDTSGSLWQFKRDESQADNPDLSVVNNSLNSKSFKYKAALARKTKYVANDRNSSVKNTKIVPPLKYPRNFWISLEMLLISCKVHLKLNWIEVCILSSIGDSAKFNMTDAKLHVPMGTLSTTDNVNLTKKLSNGFRRSVYWNNYQTIPVKIIDNERNKSELLSASFQGVKRLFVPTHDNEADIKDNTKYFLPNAKIEYLKYRLMEEISILNRLMV